MHWFYLATSCVVPPPGLFEWHINIPFESFSLEQDVQHAQDTEYGIGCDFNANVAPSRLRLSMSRLPNRGLVLEGQTSLYTVDEVSRALVNSQGCCWLSLSLLTHDFINIVSS